VRFALMPLRDLLKRLETRALLLWFALAASIWAFLGIAGEMADGELTAFDRSILLALRNPRNIADPLGPKGFEESMRDVTALGGVTVLTLVVIAAILILIFHRKHRQALVFAATIAATFVSSELLKHAYNRPRPDFLPHGSYVYSASFPSGHSTLSAATYLTLATVIASLEARRETKALIYAVAVLVVVGVGFSRIYLAVHWPSDVLAGWALGSGWAFSAWIGLNRLTRPAPVSPV
jgi:undecaprenyl-diphosphatase